MNSVTKSGKTVKDAVRSALDELGVSEEEAIIEVVNEGNKGIFGILGGKEATVTVSKIVFEADVFAKEFLQSVLKCMDVDGEVSASMDNGKIEVQISGDNMGILIGRRGETLNALQYITSLAVNKRTDEFVRVLVDTENYKKKREETLISLANRLASNAIKYRRNITLDPMSSYERRIIHSALQDNEMVNTFSTGEEPNRKVVITYKGNRR
jgi:spoIIIJ-associated protein